MQSIVDVDQFGGIEAEEWPAQIAQVAMWLTDHQMNLKVSEEFGRAYVRLPLRKSANIVHGNALAVEWEELMTEPGEWYVVGNPPFIGHQWRGAAQVADMAHIWGQDGRFRCLDYVACWYAKAARIMRDRPEVVAAFVSTNSVVQGEQVGTLWGDLLARGARIHFAHRTFQWTSEARGRAAVHCVIIGFGLAAPSRRLLFDYPDIRGESQMTAAANINPYLVDGPNVLLPSRTDPPPGLPRLKQGSKPADGGHLLLTDDERSELLAREPDASPWLRRFIGGEELINGGARWCLWLKDIPPQALRRLPLLQGRVKRVSEARLKSPTESVRGFAARPTLFTQDRQPSERYLAVPEATSENRRFIPMVFLGADVIASNKLLTMVGATLYHFGVLTSTMHMAWVRTVAGRLKSDYSYAPAVLNNFPWPDPSPAQRAAIEAAAQAVLDARAAFPGATLADLYDPAAMPPALVQAHARLDRAVDAAYGRRAGGFATEAARVAFLFDRYAALAAPLDAAPERRRPRRRAPA